MNHPSRTSWLRSSLEELHAAREHLLFSFHRIQGLSREAEQWTAEDLERIEAFTSRFARVVDLLTNKVLRALFSYELEPVETMLDRLNLAEKRGFVSNAESLKVLKEQRNVIAHDYAGSQMPPIFSFCRDHLDELESICDRVTQYANRRLME